MRIAIGALMGILMMVGLGKSAYDRYFRNRMKSPKKTKPSTSTIENPFTHADWQVRVAAIQNLEATHSSIDTLTPMLDDDDYDVRIAARDAFVAIGQPALATLLDILQTGKPDARQTAAEAIGHIGDKSAIHALIDALADESKWVRLAVLEALGHFSTQTSRKALIRIRDNDEDAQLREAAQKALS